jgi:hypothetical protein
VYVLLHTRILGRAAGGRPSVGCVQWVYSVHASVIIGHLIMCEYVCDLCASCFCRTRVYARTTGEGFGSSFCQIQNGVLVKRLAHRPHMGFVLCTHSSSEGVGVGDNGAQV